MTRTTPKTRPFFLFQEDEERILSFDNRSVIVTKLFYMRIVSSSRVDVVVYNKIVFRARSGGARVGESANRQGGVPATTETTLSPRLVAPAVPPKIPAIGLTPVLLVYTNPNANPDASAALANASWYRTSADMPADSERSFAEFVARRRRARRRR